jgi:Spy/CpxP family protein refolding chaperone
MKLALTTLAIAALAAGGTTIAAGAQAPDTDQARPRFEQRGQGPQGQGMRRGGPGMGRGQGLGQGQGFRRGGPGGPGGPGRGPALRGLNLTEAQQAQVKALLEKLRADFEAVLRPEQLATLKQRRGRGGN